MMFGDLNNTIDTEIEAIKNDACVAYMNYSRFMAFSIKKKYNLYIHI